MKLDQEDFLPNWKTIATTFNERSMDQIHSILSYFNKISCIPRNIDKPTLLQKNEQAPVTLDGISMFLNPIDYTNLSMSADNVILRTKENDSAPFRSIQNPTCMLQ